MMKDRNGKFFTRGLIISLVVGVGLWWFFSFTSIREMTSGLTSALARPFWRLGGSAAGFFAERKSFLSSRESLIEENKKLREALAHSEWRALDYRRLARDNFNWRKIFNRLGPTVEGVTVAKILTRISESPDDLVVVDVGSVNAIRPLVSGDPVLVVSDYGVGETGLILGEVFEVYGKTSKLRLYSMAGYELGVFIGSERLPAVAVGRGNGNLRIWLPRDAAVALGDSITVIRGEHEYILGFIEVIEHQPVEPLQEIIFRQPLNLNLLTEIEIHAL